MEETEHETLKRIAKALEGIDLNLDLLADAMLLREG
jgi:hypothetical protein